jgi:formylglycine-generating enzyme required for sulfatase activity
VTSENTRAYYGSQPWWPVVFEQRRLWVGKLIGSVSEWVKDWYAEDFYQTSPARDPQGPLRGSFRVLRGGEWNEKSPNFQASYRGWDEVTY